MPADPEFPVIDGEERYFSPKVDEEGALIGYELVPVPKDSHERSMAKMVHEQTVELVTKPNILQSIASWMDGAFFAEGPGDPEPPPEPELPTFDIEEIRRMLEKAEADPSWRIPDADIAKVLRTAKEFYYSGY